MKALCKAGLAAIALHFLGSRSMFRGLEFGWRAMHALATSLVVAALSACGGGSGASVEPGERNLSVQVSGSGFVQSAPQGLSCPGSCSADFATGTAITLTASPDAGQSFSGWSGACAGSVATCVVTLDQAQFVSASFAPVVGTGPYALSVGLVGTGTVNSQPAGLSCTGSTCSGNFAANTLVTLTATPGANQSFTGWSGACTGASTCDVLMTQIRLVTANFSPVVGTSFMLNTSVSGGGKLTSSPAGIDCGAACSASFSSSTAVILTAAPNAGQQFSGWGGACAGTQTTCTLQMTQARTVQAAFAATPPSASTWQPAQLLETSNDFNVAEAGHNMLVAVGPTGNAMVLWEQSDGTPDGSTRKVFSRRYLVGSGWQTAVAVPGISASSSSVDLVTGKLFMDAAGDVTWIRLENNMETRRYAPSTGWGAAFVSLGTTSFHFNHKMTSAAMDASGNIGVLVSGGNVWNSALLAGANSWTAWTRVDNGGTLQGKDAKLMLSSNGTALAIWKERNPGDTFFSMKAASHAAGVGWSTPVAIENFFTNVADAAPALAMDASGHGIAMWRHEADFYYNRFVAGSGWQGPVAITGESFLLSGTGNIQVAMTPDGRAVATWTGSSSALRSMQYQPGTGWSAPVTVEATSVDRTMVLDDNGQAVMTYQTNLPGTADFRAFSRRLVLGGQWSSSTRIDSGVGQVNAIFFAMNKSGKGTAIWDQNDVANSSVRNSLWGAILQ
jgi:hypothetical protein